MSQLFLMYLNTIGPVGPLPETQSSRFKYHSIVLNNIYINVVTVKEIGIFFVLDIFEATEFSYRHQYDSSG